MYRTDNVHHFNSLNQHYRIITIHLIYEGNRNKWRTQTIVSADSVPANLILQAIVFVGRAFVYIWK